MSVHSLDLAQARRELREAVGDSAAEDLLAEIRLILTDAERNPDLMRSLVKLCFSEEQPGDRLHATAMDQT